MLNNLDTIKGLTPEQIDALNKLGKGMSDKNDELVGKLSDLTKDTRQKQIGEASAAELESLRQFKSSAEITAAEDAKNWQEATRLKDEAHATDLEKAQGQAKTFETQVRTLLIDNGLSDALDGVNINPALKAGAIAMLHSLAELSEGKAMIGDKSLSDYIKEWASSETGKAFCLAQNNSGGNASGGSGGAAGKKWADFNPAQLSQLRQSEPEVYDQLKLTR